MVWFHEPPFPTLPPGQPEKKNTTVGLGLVWRSLAFQSKDWSPPFFLGRGRLSYIYTRNLCASILYVCMSKGSIFIFIYIYINIYISVHIHTLPTKGDREWKGNSWKGRFLLSANYPHQSYPHQKYNHLQEQMPILMKYSTFGAKPTDGYYLLSFWSSNIRSRYGVCI